jgi:hypothetical protein
MKPGAWYSAQEKHEEIKKKIKGEGIVSEVRNRELHLNLQQIGNPKCSFHPPGMVVIVHFFNPRTEVKQRI